MPSPSRFLIIPGLVSIACIASAMVGGCSSSESKHDNTGGTGGTGGSAGTCASPGGPATSPVDDHCNGDSGPIVQTTGACTTEAAGDAGAAETLPGPWGGTSASDDDCKYDVTYSVTPICEKEDVTFTVTLKKRTDHSNVSGAAPDLEVLDPSGIPAAEGSQASTETSPGVYKVTPIRFDKAGKWTIRFHFFETCSDAPEDSPHGHAAFFINVP